MERYSVYKRFRCSAQIEADGIGPRRPCRAFASQSPSDFRRKPAPIQVVWLDYFDTTGLATMDYILSDPITTPPGSSQRFAEQSAALARVCAGRRHTFLRMSPNEVPPDGSCLAVSTGWIRSTRGRSGCGQNNPGNRCLVAAEKRAFSVRVTRKLLAQFAAHGVTSGGSNCAGPQTTSNFWTNTAISILRSTRIPTPVAIGGCTLDGRAGDYLGWETMISRQTAAMLHCVGLDSLSRSPAHYLEIAVRSARRDRLAEIRAGLRAAVESSALGNANLFTRSFAESLRTIWRRWCAETRR